MCLTLELLLAISLVISLPVHFLNLRMRMTRRIMVLLLQTPSLPLAAKKMMSLSAPFHRHTHPLPPLHYLWCLNDLCVEVVSDLPPLSRSLPIPRRHHPPPNLPHPSRPQWFFSAAPQRCYQPALITRCSPYHPRKWSHHLHHLANHQMRLVYPKGLHLHDPLQNNLWRYWLHCLISEPFPPGHGECDPDGLQLLNLAFYYFNDLYN